MSNMFKVNTAKNAVFLPNFLVWTFCRKAQFRNSFGQIAWNCAETVPFHKISVPGNEMKLQYFSQCNNKGTRALSLTSFYFFFFFFFINFELYFHLFLVLVMLTLNRKMFLEYFWIILYISQLNFWQILAPSLH